MARRTPAGRVVDASETSNETTMAETTETAREVGSVETGSGDWDALLGLVELEDVKPRPSIDPVEVPDQLVALLMKLDQPGENGGRQRGKLPVKDAADFERIRRTIRAAVERLPEPRSVTTKPMYRDEDVVPVKGKVKTTMQPKDGAVPTHISFLVGPRRGAKPNGGSDGLSGE